MLRAATGWVPFIALLASGCFASKGRPDAPAEAPAEAVSISELCETLGEATAAGLAICPPSELLEMEGADVAAAVEAECTREVLPALDVGRVLYDGAAMAQCVAALRQRCPLDGVALPAAAAQACAQALSGSLDEGDRCYEGVECTSGICLHDQVAGRAPDCPGVCAEPGGPSEGCGVHECADTLLCVGGLCALSARTRDVCEGHDDVCAPGLGCGWEEEAGRAQCRSPNGQGAVCYGPRDCAFPLRCEELPGALEATCEPPPATAADGEPCALERRCEHGLYCKTGYGSSAEDPGLCTPRHALDAACDVGGANDDWIRRGCARGACAAGEGQRSGTCQYVGEGGTCVAGSVPAGPATSTVHFDSCGPGLRCVRGVCEPSGYRDSCVRE